MVWCVGFPSSNVDVDFLKSQKMTCQQWDLNPRPFGPVPETGALDQLGHIDTVDLEVNEPWRRRVSIPVPLACKASALPFELHPQWMTRGHPHPTPVKDIGAG